MKKFILFCSVLSFFGVSCVSMFTVGPGYDQALETLYERLESGNALDHRLDKLMRRILPRITSEIGDLREVLVNSDYSKNAVNFYVVRPEQLRRIVGTAPPTFRSWHEAGEILKWNLVVVRPNLVFADDIFLSNILICTEGYADIINRVEKSEGSDKRFAPLCGRKESVAGMYARYMMMLMLIDDRNSLRRGIEQWHSDILGYLPLPTQEELFLLSMLLILGHEFAHLREGSEVGYQQIIQLVSDLLTGKPRHEEEMADEIAISAVKRYYHALVSSHAADKGSKNVKEVPIFQTYAIIAVANILRDQALVEMFDGFRGLRAPEVFVRVTRWDEVCNDPERAYGPIALEEVSCAFTFGGFPILTESEFNGLRKRLLEETHLAAHIHAFVRNAKLRGILEDLMPRFRQQAEEELRPFRALLENQPSKATPTIVPNWLQNAGLGVTRSFVERTFQGAVRFEEGVTCPKDSCIVGFFDKGPGYIEIIGPPADVKLLSLVFPTGTKGQRESFASWCERLMNNVGVVVSDDLRQNLWKLIEKLASCPGASSLTVHGRVVVTFEQLNSSPFTVLRLNGR
jgi:hypothetical protein